MPKFYGASVICTPGQETKIEIEEPIKGIICTTEEKVNTIKPKDEPFKYCDTDVITAKASDKAEDQYKAFMNFLFGVQNLKPKKTVPGIKKVIFQKPAVILFWEDNTKTVVKAHGDDEYDPEKGLAMAIAKKALGNDYAYYNIFKHFLKQAPKRDDV